MVGSQVKDGVAGAGETAAYLMNRDSIAYSSPPFQKGAKFYLHARFRV